MGLLDKIKLKAAEYAAKNLATEMERGTYGQIIQKAYVATKGQKTLIGTVLSIIVMSIAQFTPPWADSGMRYIGLGCVFLTALGLLDKVRRKEPIFEPWFLDALATVSAWVAAASGVVLGFASGGAIDLLFPGHPGLSDQISIITSAITTATAFLNRLAKANAAPTEKKTEGGK